MLGTSWAERQNKYDFVVIGSGYGGAITAARLASAALSPKPSVCILERGKEWQPEDFPETPVDIAGATLNDINPLGLFELLNHQDISIIKGSGLGGTSLINANVAIRPDREVFEQFNWPASISYDELSNYYDRARGVLASAQHPRTLNEPKLAKFKALEVRARELGMSAESLHINVNFTIDGKNPYGVEQKPCIDCGNCVCGCKVRAKNTLAMNYLPMAKNAGATILTQARVEWLEKRNDGTWRIHGKHVNSVTDTEDFIMDAGEIILSAGSLNSTEILLRSEAHGLRVSPALGTKFSGNGDFFGLAYNGDYETDVTGYLHDHKPGAGDSGAPGPNIVGLVRYTDGVAENQRLAVEDFSFPSAYIDGAKALFGLLQGQKTVSGNEAAQRDRFYRDLNPGGRLHDLGGAINHSLLYLVMGHDNARGVILFEASPIEPDGRIRISWDKAGQAQIFTKMNEEIRRHAHALRANFISNPTWSVFNLRHLITAHPLGGCPMGDDYMQGAVDSFGRLFSGDGSVHQGLSVSDGSVLPSALGVNPLLTISALTERFSERKIAQLGGENYPEPVRPVRMGGIQPLETIRCNEGQLEALFRRCPTMGMETLLNQDSAPVMDTITHTIRSCRYWKGFYPPGHVLNPVSAASFTGFQKQFFTEEGRSGGITSDIDGHILTRTKVEEVEIAHDSGGTLEPGRYLLVRSLDPPWQGFYDVLRIISDDLLIGRTYAGQYPHGARLFTFPMSRLYSIDHMTPDDRAAFFAKGAAVSANELDGVWRLDAISNANQAGAIAYLKFSLKSGGALKSRYQPMGMVEALVIPSFLKDYFTSDDFTPFLAQMRAVDADLLVGKYIAPSPTAVAAPFGASSLGLFHPEPGGTFAFYYMLRRVSNKELPANALLQSFLDIQLPDGVGMTVHQPMTGWYFPGDSAADSGRDDRLTTMASVPDGDTPPGAIACQFDGRIVIRDVNDFVDGYHEAVIQGTVQFAAFEDMGAATFTIDDSVSTVTTIRSNGISGEAEERYHLEFCAHDGRRFALDGNKSLRKMGPSGPKAIPGLLIGYTTVYARVRQGLNDGETSEMGSALLRFQTFEQWHAASNLTAYLASLDVADSSDPVVQFLARMRFVAFIAQFVGSAYDPLGF